MAYHLPSKTQKFLDSAVGSPYLAVRDLTMSVTSSRSPSAWNCATNRESVMNARSRATPPCTSAWILATTSPASAWTRLFSIFVPVASANVLTEPSSAAFAASEYSFCDSIPMDVPFKDAAASSSSFGTVGPWGVDGEPSPHAARPAAPSTPTPSPRKSRRDHNGLSFMAVCLLRLASSLHAECVPGEHRVVGHLLPRGTRWRRKVLGLPTMASGPPLPR